MLTMAGIVQPIYTSSASGLPLGALANEKKFKAIFLDVGLAQNMCGLQAAISFDQDILQVNRGAIAEQFVGQELQAYHEPYETMKLYFWARDKKNSQAEVDYVIQVDDKIIPVEVKSGKTGRLKSLKIFMEEKKSPLGIRICQSPLSLEDSILTVPLYMTSRLPALIRDIFY